jgi:dihydroflavonol-4-reductase
MGERVLVTGISGYVGLHIAKELLEGGYDVVGSVRSLEKSASVRSALSAVVSTDQLEFVALDLLTEKGWDEALHGCAFVIHVASPFVLAEPKDENELIAPALEGTIRVIKGAKRAGVKRLVLTSSVVAMTAGKPSGTYDETAWSEINLPIGAYAKSKTLAERAAWDLVQDGEMELVAINPGFILGPPIGAPGEGQSIAMIAQLIGGKMPMIPDVAMGMVDVRDVARLHVAALKTPDASGKRFIAASEQPIAMSTLCSVLRNAGYDKVPHRKAPNFAIKLMSLFDREAKGMVPQLGKRVAYDTRATYDVLEWKQTPFETTLLEMATSLA